MNGQMCFAENAVRRFRLRKLPRGVHPSQYVLPVMSSAGSKRQCLFRMRRSRVGTIPPSHVMSKSGAQETITRKCAADNSAT
jgi:hypothetical protein